MKPSLATDSNHHSSPLDIHLVLNGLNRVASSFFAHTGLECDDLYAVSEYIALAMRLSGAPLVAYSDEAELLGKYLTLANACKNGVLTIRVSTLNIEKLSVPPHLSCDVAGCLLQALKVKDCKNWSIQADFGVAGIRFQLRPAVRVGIGSALPEGVRRELSRLQQRNQTSFSIHASEESDVSGVSSGLAQTWTITIRPVPQP